MPCIYAHDSFGKRVAEQLPEELQHIITNHQKEFRAGLQGPDFLFFYHPMLKLRTNQMGYWQHGQPILGFLKRLLPIIRKEGTDSGVYAYVLGYICHYMLDSECHSFVIPMSKNPGYNHLAMENEFDRHLIRKDGFRPITYPVWKKVTAAKEVVEAINKVYHPLKLSEKAIRESLYGMRFYKWLLTSGKSLKRAAVRLGMKLSMHYEELEGHMEPKQHAYYQLLRSLSVEDVAEKVLLCKEACDVLHHSYAMIPPCSYPSHSIMLHAGYLEDCN